jgi:hypothetical protein
MNKETDFAVAHLRSSCAHRPLHGFAQRDWHSRCHANPEPDSSISTARHPPRPVSGPVGFSTRLLRDTALRTNPAPLRDASRLMGHRGPTQSGSQPPQTARGDRHLSCSARPHTCYPGNSACRRPGPHVPTRLGRGPASRPGAGAWARPGSCSTPARPPASPQRGLRRRPA